MNVRALFSLFPLITGHLTRDINELLLEHLANPLKFWTRCPVPTVALDDPKYNPTKMWSGPTWVNVNYLLIEV